MRSVLDAYRWPAEWEPHTATWLSWPHNRETWPTAFARAEAAFVEIASALTEVERVRIGGSPDRKDIALNRLATSDAVLEQIDWVDYPTTDAWVRDHGPIFMTSANGASIALDFEFDNWGRKYPGWS